jgi:hypothetical protein
MKSENRHHLPPGALCLQVFVKRRRPRSLLGAVVGSPLSWFLAPLLAIILFHQWL